MYLNPANIFSRKKPLASVRVLKPLVVNGQHQEPGTIIEINQDSLQNFSPGDLEILNREVGKADSAPATDPAPPRPENAPLPARWDQLPECFTQWHEITEDFRTARLHIKMIEECRVNTFGTAANLFQNSDVKDVLVNRLRVQPAGNYNVVYSRHEIDLTDPRSQQLERFIAAAETRAFDFLERLHETKGHALQLAYYKCGMARVGSSEASQAVITELEILGFKLFSTRVSALGLGPHQIHQLFRGSADFHRFAAIQKPHLGGVCFAGADEDGTMRTYSDDSPTASATFLLRELDRFPSPEITCRGVKRTLQGFENRSLKISCIA